MGSLYTKSIKESIALYRVLYNVSNSLTSRNQKRAHAYAKYLESKIIETRKALNSRFTYYLSVLSFTAMQNVVQIFIYS